MKLRNQRLVAQLRRALEEECDIYTDYNQTLAEERELLRKLKTSESTERLAALVGRRDALTQAMQRCHQHRQELLKDFENASSRKLSEVLSRDLHPADAAQLMPHVNKLKKLVLKSRDSSIEFGQIVSFSLSMLNGLLSIFYSATQSVVRSYSRRGQIKENFHPSRNRAETLLKEV